MLSTQSSLSFGSSSKEINQIHYRKSSLSITDMNSGPSNVCTLFQLRGPPNVWASVLQGRDKILLLGEALKFAVNSKKVH